MKSPMKSPTESPIKSPIKSPMRSSKNPRALCARPSRTPPDTGYRNITGSNCSNATTHNCNHNARNCKALQGTLTSNRDKATPTTTANNQQQATNKHNRFLKNLQNLLPKRFWGRGMADMSLRPEDLKVPSHSSDGSGTQAPSR